MPPTRLLYILVEGDDDERFVARILKPQLIENFPVVKIWKYASQTKQARKKFLRTVVKQGYSYIFMADLDLFACVTDKKNALRQENVEIDSAAIMVVVREIESWYAAGIRASEKQERNLRETNRLAKEQFLDMIPKGITKLDFFENILADYDAVLAQQRNKSFNYFCNKYLPQLVSQGM